MARLLLPLLLLCSAHAATASPKQKACAIQLPQMAVTPVVQCPTAPCNTTEDNVALTLPVLLSLEDPRMSRTGRSVWGMALHLLGHTRAQHAEVLVKWEKQREVFQMVNTCGGHGGTVSFPVDLQPSNPWLHLLVEATRQEVTFNPLKALGKVPAMIVTFQNDPPDTVQVFSRTTLGYSATNDTVDPTNATTTTISVTATTTGSGAHTDTLLISLYAALGVGVAALLLGILLAAKSCGAQGQSTASTITTPPLAASLPTAPALGPHLVLGGSRVLIPPRPCTRSPVPHHNSNNCTRIELALTKPHLSYSLPKLPGSFPPPHHPSTPLFRHESVNSLYGVTTTGAPPPYTFTPPSRHDSVNSLYGVVAMPEAPPHYRPTPPSHHDSENDLYDEWPGDAAL